MTRYIRNTAILAKIETTEGTDSVPTGAANALLVSDVSINALNRQNAERNLLLPYFGGNEQLAGPAFKEVGFTVELAGSGTAGTAPAWGPLVEACGFVGSGAAGFRQFAPGSPASQKSCTIYYFDDGVRHRLLGAKGTFTLSAGVGDRPTLAFTFQGLDGGDTAVSNPAVTLTAFRAPLVITDANTGDVRMGGTYDAGAVTSGTAYTSRGLELSLGNTVSFTPLLGGEFIDLSARAVTGTIQLNLTAIQQVALMTAVKSNSFSSMSLEHGSAAGAIVGVFMAAVQLSNPTQQEVNGRRLIGFELGSVPLAGNDDLIIYTK